MKFSNLIFDLDGTLIDSKRGIFNSVIYTMDQLSIPEDKRPSNLNPFIGPPLRQSFKQLFQMNDEKAEKATSIYREYYKKHGLYQFEIFPGIEESLKFLKNTGFSISLVTSKAEIYAQLIINSTPFSQVFETISGCEIDGRRSEKRELIAYTLNKLNISASKEILMIGDRYHDIRGAKACGISSAAVTYGYGTSTELISEIPDLVLKDPLSLKKLNFLSKRH